MIQKNTASSLLHRGTFWWPLVSYLHDISRMLSTTFSSILRVQLPYSTIMYTFSKQSSLNIMKTFVGTYAVIFKCVLPHLWGCHMPVSWKEKQQICRSANSRRTIPCSFRNRKAESVGHTMTKRKLEREILMGK